ncbi:MAG: thiol reductant ABC exporter subunit CydD [Thioalkalivibrio sp.]|nr:thiol reductant ABC exporter subunit CydD [Thioalkalivibrio sp.]
MNPSADPGDGTSTASEAHPRAFLRTLLQPHRRWLHLAWLAGAGAGLATVALAAAVAWSIHLALFGQGTAPAWPWLGAAVLAVLLRHGLQALRDWSGQQLAFAVRADLRQKLIATASRLGPVHLAHRGHSGSWASRYQEQVDALAGYYARYLPALGLTLAVPGLLLAAAFSQDWVAGLLLLLSAPLIPVFMALIGMGSEQIHQAQQERQNRLAGHFLDRIRALDLLRRSLALEAARQDVAEAADDYRRLSMRVLRVAFLSSAVMEFFSAVAIGLVAIYVGFALLGFLEFGPAGELTLFSGLFVLLLAPEYFQPLRQFAQSYHDRAGAIAVGAELAPLLQPPTVTGHPAALRAASGPTLLRLHNVTVRYEPDMQPALSGVELDIARGEQTAVVGPSGSGKSTLLALCAGFVQADSGSVAIATDARPFAWIGQRVHLFHGSLRENLLLGAPEHTPDPELGAAMATAGLRLDDPTLPHGLDTPIGEDSRGLSGGQAQRVAFARALLSGSRLWLLDEPTSALDPQTEDDLLTRLLAHARARDITVLVATHQESVYRRLGRIVRLAEGRLQEDSRV